MTAPAADTGTASGPAAPPVTHRFVRELMGMPWSVHVRTQAPDDGQVATHVDRAYTRLEWIDRVFSPYRPDSVVRRLDRDEMTVAEAPRAVGLVERWCDRAESVTGGAFSARFRTDGPAWDPTGLVKGWALAEAGAILGGIPGARWSVNAGGDVAVGVGVGAGVAEPGSGEPWRIGIDDPADPGRVVEVVELTEGAVCTSGTAARGAHLVDPATGTPVTTPGSVSVVGPEVIWADVWATALFVGGDDAARRFERWTTTEEGRGYRAHRHRVDG